MGVFFEMQEVVNRTSKVLHVRFDGQDIELEPNYNEKGERNPEVRNMLPLIAVPYAKSQNVLMGSESPDDPTDYTVLVGAVAKKGAKQKDDLGFLEQSDALTRVSLEEMLDGDPSVKEIKVAGKRNQARARRGETTAPNGQTPFDIRMS